MNLTTQLRSWARALSADHYNFVGILNPDNSLRSWASLEHAVKHDLPFFIRLGDHVTAYDLDDENGLVIAEEIVDLFSPEVWLICRSGPGSRAHLFLRHKGTIPCPRLLAYCKSRGADLRRTIRPPFAKHRDGISRSIPLQEVSHEMFVL